MQNKTYVISFGNNDYYRRLSDYLVYKIAKYNPNFIPIVYSKKNLPDEMIGFCEQHKKIYGFGIWKPYIILKTLEIMNYGDILLYIDGRTYYTGKQIMFHEEIKNNNELDCVFWQMEDLFEFQYTKDDFFKLLEITDLSIIESGQIASGIFSLRKNKHTLQLMQKWNIFMLKNKTLLIDYNGGFTNNVRYISNRHDQSILSLLVKSNQSLTIKYIKTSRVHRDSLKPHSLPHQYTFPYIIEKLPLSVIRLIYAFKRTKLKQLSKKLFFKITGN